MEIQTIQNRIYEIRGCKVMLDKDLASLYEVETKRLKEAVRRNIERFPSDFMFMLTDEETNSLRTQFATLKGGRGQHSKYGILAFSEYGIVMLSSILNSSRAIEVNIQVVRAFIAMREHLSNYKELEHQIRQLERDCNMQFNDVYLALAEFASKEEERKPNPNRRPIGYKTE